MIKFLIGIDEAGRGPIAGPVAVGAFCVPLKFRRKLKGFFPNRQIRDSKKLSPAVRERIFRFIKGEFHHRRIFYTVFFGGAIMIDRKGISFVIRQALEKSLNALGVSPYECEVFLDGGLKAPERFKRQRTIVKGDEKEAVIALASIVAKVSRDRKMLAFAKKHPEYGFGRHKGYGTKAHYEALEKHGLSPIHRRSFLKNPCL